jgi:hypothetical protein
MKLDTIEDISKLFDLCNKKGIESMRINAGFVEFKMKDNFAPKKRIRNTKEELQDFATPEEAALFWSSQPISGE